MAEKITQIGILVEESLKKDFQAICKAQDKNASQEIRALMREYIKNHRVKNEET
ncbi:CopG family transcriptional regulator [Acinetobacter baumannii]|uniref:CopG family transcriptional regulator n=1 Tax=Acinetobacter baumannii TaxID=470 RepID=UPI001120A985|nr:CopG family transcriptional regulator [Acinetobacter baumannii]